MKTIDIIEKKKNAVPLSEEDIQFIIDGTTTGSIPDYQLSALMMAIYFNDMTDKEIGFLTIAMVKSGLTIDLSSIDGIKVDKHSTGGVADTTTLIAAPMVAALGIPIAKISGRGLGHTGGTLDKLESIPGFDINVDVAGIIKNVKECGLSIVGQTNNLVPADKKLYALRDVTATVNSIPLIAASIMSKKIASGCDGLVLDVKIGSGSFSKDYDSAYRLAKTMVNLGKIANLKTIAIISDMNQPLGMAVGNALEVKEAIKILNGSIKYSRLKDVAIIIATNMVMIGENNIDSENIRERLNQSIENGSALKKLAQMISAQNGDSSVIYTPNKIIDAKYAYDIFSTQKGCLWSMNCESLGRVGALLGAGREKKTDTIDYSVGYELKVELGDRIEIGQKLAKFYANDMKKAKIAEDLFRKSIFIGDEEYIEHPLIYDVLR